MTQQQQTNRPPHNPHGLKRNCREVRGFDYRAGVPCERTAREWREIRQQVIEAGGFIKWYRGEMWLFDKKLVFLYEVYFGDGNELARGGIRADAGECDDEQH